MIIQTKAYKIKKISNFSNKILCLGHEIKINVNWHVQNL
jgi:hypothetical protein